MIQGTNLRNVVLMILVVGLYISGCGNAKKDNSGIDTIDHERPNSVQAYDNAVINGYEGSMNEWLTSIIGENVYIKNGIVKIGDTDTGIKGLRIDPDKDFGDVKVIAYHINADRHLILELSDKSELDLGETNEATNIETIDVLDNESDDSEEKKTEQNINSDNHMTDSGNNVNSEQSELVGNSSEQNNTCSFKVDKINSTVGAQSVRLSVNVMNNPGILGMMLSISYDESILKLKKIENGGALKGLLTMTTGKELKSGCKVLWDGTDIKEEHIKDGEIMVLEFDVADEVDKGTYPIELGYNVGDIVDGNMNEVEPVVENGSITID